MGSNVVLGMGHHHRALFYGCDHITIAVSLLEYYCDNVNCSVVLRWSNSKCQKHLL